MEIKEVNISDFIINTPNGIIVTDCRNCIKFLNSSVEKFLGVKTKEVIGKELATAIPEFKDTIFEEGKIYFITHDKTNYHVMLFHMMDKNNELTKIHIIAEMEENLALKAELKHQKYIIDELNEILEGSYDGILVTDKDGNVLLVNSSYERITAIKKDEMLGKNMRDLFNPVWMPNSVAFVVSEQRQPVSKKQVTKEGKNIIVTGMPIFDKKGEIKKIVINARDISEIYELREELLKTKEINKAYIDNYKEFLNSGEKGHNGILAASNAMQEVLKLAQKVANFQATVLVLGESGVGKEEVARYIYMNSLRSNRPFITINCGAIPSNLLESELFGYEKGAFTGANQTGKAGLLESADEGVVFLDEIGETPLDFQVKLLRFLETKEVRRVGAVAGKVVDVRIIAATNRELESMVNEGTFREDLYYRLNVVKIKVPPLRKRIDDIAPLAMFFLSNFNEKYKQSKELTFDVIKELEKYAWPGNVRQLKNVMENMVVVSNNDYLQVDDLPWNIDFETSGNKKIMNIITDNENLTLAEATELLERMMLEKAKIKYKTTRLIADKLQVDQSTIVRKLNKYNL